MTVGGWKDPVVERHGDEWRFLWPESNVLVNVDGLRESGEGLHAEIEVRYALAHANGSTAAASNGKSSGKGGLIHGPVRVNLLSTQARSTLAKHLNSRLDTLDWPSIVEYFCAKSAQDYRLGEPFVDLATLPMPQGERYLIDRVIPLNETSIIYAKGGSMKSLLAMAMAVAVATGKALPCGLRPTQQGRVCYLDWETTESEQRERIEWIARGLGVPVPRIFYRRQMRTIADDAARIRAELDRLEISFVVVDSIAAACGGEPESADVALRTMNALRTFRNCTRLVVAHVTKSAGDLKEGSTSPFGSVFFRELARSTWEVRKSEEGATDSDIAVGMFHRKVNRGREQPPIGIKYTFGDNRVTLSGYDVSQDVELSSYAPLSYRIRTILGRGAKTVAQLADTLDAKETTIKTALRRMPDVQPLGDSRGGRGKETPWGLKDDRF